MDYKRIIEDIVIISKKAGNKILEIYNSPDIDINIEVKKDLSPLTIADKASNEIIINELNSLSPRLPILSEEEKNVEYKNRKDWSEFWLVDPLDGTKEFINRNGEFTVNIALIKNNQPIMGVVYAPVPDITWYGLENFGSFIKRKDEVPKKINLNNTRRDVTKIVSSRSHANNPKLESYMKQFKKYELIKMGSSIKMCLVADGTADCYPRFGPTMEWDTGAAHAVVKYAGGNIYNIESNKELIYNKESLLNPGFIVK
jgi:3'(2'), 5'-bisphosphate nucleotidase